MELREKHRHGWREEKERRKEREMEEGEERENTHMPKPTLRCL